MSFDNIYGDNFRAACGFTSEKEDSSMHKEDMAERRQMVQSLKEQIRAGTYRPTIGEIAISLVKGRFKSKTA
ncbi:MAG: hypothetical protein BA863_03875 [Desulfovibrio sp. S3730MH75]|nr:MAG: hypothetical protein BA863_03875 [Desulfovibrio sp. S3730MH75]